MAQTSRLMVSICHNSFRRNELIHINCWLTGEILQVLLRRKNSKQTEGIFWGTYDCNNTEHLSASDPTEASGWLVPSDHRHQAPDLFALGKPESLIS